MFPQTTLTREIAAQINVFKDQYAAPLAARLKTAARHHIAFLTEDRRQRAGLEELSSGLFYGGEMQSGLDRDDQVADLRHQWLQDIVKKQHEKSPQRTSTRLQTS